jgi:Stage II sporulation protein E (SpoIIE)
VSRTVSFTWGILLSSFSIALNIIGGRLDVVGCCSAYVGVPQNPLNHHVRNSESVKIASEAAPRRVPAVPLRDAAVALVNVSFFPMLRFCFAASLAAIECRENRAVTARLSMEQFPLGLIPGGCYASQRVPYSSRDLFLMLTDGISEVPDDRDEEFGLARLEQLLTQYSAEPLSQIWEGIMEQVRRHGLQQDDQSLLLVRVLH